MARTITDSFMVFKSNLEITDLQQSTVSVRQKNVREAMENGLNVTNSFLTGSYSRHTMITPLNEADIDIFILLDSQYYYHYNGKNGGQAALLDLAKRTLKKTYPNTPDISRNGQAVTIQFTDFNVDVIPAFSREGGGYLIPNSIGQSWLVTDPRRHVEIMSAANQSHNGDIVPLIKMIKRWNREINSYFRSFHLEVITLQILDGITISNFPSGARYFFDKGRAYVKKKTPDPAGYGGDVGSYLNSNEKIGNAASRFNTAYTRAVKAEDYASRGNVTEAINMWRLIFGNHFPTYG